jgi:outer membrane protein TolC
MQSGGRRVAFLILVAGAVAGRPLWAQTQPPPAAVPPFVLAQPEAQSGPPPVVTLQDALERARQNDLQFQAATADAAVAHEDRVQARAALLPSLSHTTQYLGTQDDTPLATGRFVSNDGVNLYRSWMVAHGEIAQWSMSRYQLKCELESD